MLKGFVMFCAKTFRKLFIAHHEHKVQEEQSVLHAVSTR